MKVLFATTNSAKIAKYKNRLENYGIELITIKDLDFKINVNEDGRSAIENACKKAKAYYDVIKIPTIGMDNTLYIEGLSEEKQPGTHVRRVMGKELSDEEMIEYYRNLAKEYGGKLTAKWVYGMAIYNKNRVEKLTWNKGEFYIIDTPCKKRNPGYPLDSISIMKYNNRYFLDVKKEEDIKNEKDEVIDFIVNSINKEYL